MKTIETQIERKLQLWTLIGPLCIILTLAFSLLKHSDNPLLLPYVALVGVALSWRWQMRGLAVTCGFILAVITYQLTSIPPEDRFWELGISIAIALGCLVTALSFDEAKRIVLEEYTSPSTNFDQLRSQLNGQLETLSLQLKNAESEALEQAQNHDKLITLTRHEILQNKNENEGLRNELLKSKLEADLIREKLEEEQNNFRLYGEHCKKQQEKVQNENGLLKENLAALEKEKNDLLRVKKQLSLFEERIQILEKEKKQAQEESREFNNALYRLQKEADDIQLQKTTLEVRLQTLESEYKELENAYLKQKGEWEEMQTKQERSKPHDWKEFRRVEGLYLQMRSQFDEKSLTLDNTRKELFHLQEKLEQLRLEQEEKYVYERSQYEKTLEQYIEKVEHRYAAKEESLTNEIEMLQEIITTLSNEVTK